MEEIRIPDEVHTTCAQIADLAQSLGTVLETVMDGMAERQVCTLTLRKIMELADRFV